MKSAVSRCVTVSHFKLLSATKYAITNLISWFSVYNFTKTVKQAGDRIFSCASMCQKSSQYGTILQSYCTNKKGAIFYASQCSFCGGGVYRIYWRQTREEWEK